MAMFRSEDLPPDGLRAELEDVRRKVEHLYDLRGQVVGGYLSPRQVQQYQALLHREQQLLAALARSSRPEHGVVRAG